MRMQYALIGAGEGIGMGVAVADGARVGPGVAIKNARWGTAGVKQKAIIHRYGVRMGVIGADIAGGAREVKIKALLLDRGRT